MKRVFMIFACLSALMFSSKVDAQIQKTNNENSGVKKINTPLLIKAVTPFSANNFGKNFNANDLSHTPYHNINSVANMVVGVNSNGGQTPNIKGAPASGTAYYVDGVRVYGAMPIFR